MKLTGILPVMRSDLYRSMFLLKSLEKYDDQNIIGKIIIIVPNKDKKKAKKVYKDLKKRIEVITEEDLIGNDCIKYFKKLRGWQKQQVLKLLISSRIDTDAYICFDADILAIDDLKEYFNQKKYPINIQPVPVNKHRIWWENSKSFIKYEEKLPVHGIGITPSILYVDWVRGLLSHIKELYENPPCIALCKNPYWTEYSLYWLYLLKKHSLEEIDKIYNQNTLLYGKSLFLSDEIKSENFNLIFNNPSAPFTIIQSKKLCLYDLNKICIKYLDIRYNISIIEYLFEKAARYILRYQRRVMKKLSKKW